MRDARRSTIAIRNPVDSFVKHEYIKRQLAYDDIHLTDKAIDAVVRGEATPYLEDEVIARILELHERTPVE